MQNEETKLSPLSRAKFFTSSFFIHNAVFVLIALLALLIRWPQLSERPMHTDESVNAYIVGNLLAGEPFHYDSQDRHGPLLYLLAEPVAKLCGAKNLSELTESQLRFTPVIIGSAMVLMFSAAVEMFGFSACLVAALLFAFAPLPVYYSRYFIHETIFVLATWGVILAGGRAVKANSIWAAAFTGFLAALMLACKETAVIHFFALAGAVLIGSWLKQIARPTLKQMLAAAVVFLVTTILLFTWFGRNWSALADLYHAVSRFTARAGGEGHEKPFNYYYHLLDPLVLLTFLALAGIYAAISDAANGVRKAALTLVIYAVLVAFVYSAIPYKTPWLALNLWLPFALLCGLGVTEIWGLIKSSAGRAGVIVAGICLFLTLGMQTKELCFDHPADERNPFAYSHTSEDLLRLPARITELAQRNKMTNPRIAVVLADAWPLPWYLRKFSQVGFWQPEQATGDADFFITGVEPSADLAERLSNFRPEFFGARSGVLLKLWSPILPSP